MRFSIIAIFIFPLAALAAPAPAPDKLELLPLGDQFTNAITETATGLNSTIASLKDPTLLIDKRLLQAARDNANVADEKLRLASSAAAMVDTAMKTGGQVNDDAYVDNPRVHEGQND